MHVAASGFVGRGYKSLKMNELLVRFLSGRSAARSDSPACKSDDAEDIFFYFIAEKFAKFKYFSYLCIKLNKQKHNRYGLHTLLGIQGEYRSERL